MSETDAPKPSEHLVTEVTAEPKPAVVTVYDPRTGRRHRVSKARAAVLLSRGFSKSKA